MMKTRELFSYDKLKEEITSSIIYQYCVFEYFHPVNKDCIADILSALLKHSVENHTIETIPEIQKIITWVKQINNSMDQCKLLLPEIYHQFAEVTANYSTLSQKMDYAFKNKKLNLYSHYISKKFLDELVKVKPKLEALARMVVLPQDQLNDDVACTEALDFVLEQSQLIFYINETILNELRKLDAWNTYEYYDLLYKKKNESNERGQILYLMEKAEKNLPPLASSFIELQLDLSFEDTILFLNENYELFSPQLKQKLSPEVIQRWLRNYIDIANGVKPQKTEVLIENKSESNQFVNYKIENKSESNQFVNYKIENQYESSQFINYKIENKLESNQFINYKYVSSTISHLFDRVPFSCSATKETIELWKYVLEVANRVQHEKALYQFAMVQNIIERMYSDKAVPPKNAVDQSILWINKIIKNILTQDALHPHAESIILKVIMPLVCLMTMPYFPFPSSSMFFSREKTAKTLLNKSLRELFDGSILSLQTQPQSQPLLQTQPQTQSQSPRLLQTLPQPQSQPLLQTQPQTQSQRLLQMLPQPQSQPLLQAQPQPQSQPLLQTQLQPELAKPRLQDAVRKKWLDELTVLKSEYTNDFIRVISGASNKELAEKLILRLAAVDYLQQKIHSPDAIDGWKIKTEMKSWFGPLIFEKKYYRKSSLEKIVDRLMQSPARKLNLFTKKIDKPNVSEQKAIVTRMRTLPA